MRYKKKHYRVLRLIKEICLLSATVCFHMYPSSHLDAKEISEQIEYEIRGYCELPNYKLFSVRNVQTGGSGWVKENQLYGAITVLSYNTNTGLFRVMYRDREVFLKLKDRDESALAVITSTILHEELLTEIKIKQLVEAYEKELSASLPDTSHKLYSSMEKSLANRVNAYQNELEAKLKEQNNTTEGDTTAVIAANNLKPRIGSLRTENQVNSRIWASDHIKVHGEPGQ